MLKKEQIPEIKIERKERSELGLGIMKISQLKALKQPREHNPYKSHRLKFNLIIFIKEGAKGHHNIDFKTYKYDKNSILFVAKDQIHHFIDLPKSNDGFLIVFNETILMDFGSMIINHFISYNIFEPYIQLSQNTMSDIEDLIAKFEIEIKKSYSAVQKKITQTYLKLILLKIIENRDFLLKDKPHNQKSLSISIEFRNLVKKHLATEKNTSFYANTLHITKQKLNAITQEIFQLSAKQYIVNTIILEAKRLLKSTELTVKEISYQLGFDEPTNFNKFFKHNTNMSPMEFSNSTI